MLGKFNPNLLAAIFSRLTSATRDGTRVTVEFASDSEAEIFHNALNKAAQSAGRKGRIKKKKLDKMVAQAKKSGALADAEEQTLNEAVAEATEAADSE